MTQARTNPIPPQTVNDAGFCDAKVAATDIAQYYALLFLPPTRRRAAMALYALWYELREINDECTDPQVAQVKLAWWREETQEMWAGRPRHPVSRAMVSHKTTHAVPPLEIAELLAALVEHVGATGYQTDAELQWHGERTRGRVESLAASITSERADVALMTPLAKLGATLEVVEVLRAIGHDARRGRVYLPRERLSAFGVKLEDLCAARNNTGARALLVDTVERLDDDIAQQAVALDRFGSAMPLPARVEIHAARLLLAKLRDQPERLLRERPQVPSWRLLWSSWRLARTYRRSLHR